MGTQQAADTTYCRLEDLNLAVQSEAPRPPSLTSGTRGSITILLDDIFDKLDAGRVERIIQFVSGEAFGQIFITDTNRTHLDMILGKGNFDYHLYAVAHGNVTLESHV